MSAGVSGVSAVAAVAAARPSVQRADARSALRLPEEQAFKVATINERLASTAAKADQAGAVVDIKA